MSFTLDEASGTGGLRGTMVLFEKHVHLQKEIGSIETASVTDPLFFSHQFAVCSFTYVTPVLEMHRKGMPT